MTKLHTLLRGMFLGVILSGGCLPSSVDVSKRTGLWRLCGRHHYDLSRSLFVPIN